MRSEKSLLDLTMECEMSRVVLVDQRNISGLDINHMVTLLNNFSLNENVAGYSHSRISQYTEHFYPLLAPAEMPLM